MDTDISTQRRGVSQTELWFARNHREDFLECLVEQQLLRLPYRSPFYFELFLLSFWWLSPRRTWATVRFFFFFCEVDSAATLANTFKFTSDFLHRLGDTNRNGLVVLDDVTFTGRALPVRSHNGSLVLTVSNRYLKL